MCITKQVENPLVSIIMPAYNAENYIEEAINSVIAQSVSAWELIIIDDCSTDATYKVASKFAERDSRISVMKNEVNSGVARTRNRGLELCKGDFVALLDSDDYWKPQMLEKMIGKAQKTRADITYCSYELVDEQGRKVCNDFIVPPATTFEESIVKSVITCSSVLLTAELAREIRFPTDVYHEDIALWFRILKEGKKARGVSEVLMSYRQRENSRAGNKLISAKRRWEIYRKCLDMSVMRSIKLMTLYAYYGVIKYKRL